MESGYSFGDTWYEFWGVVNVDNVCYDEGTL